MTEQTLTTPATPPIDPPADPPKVEGAPPAVDPPKSTEPGKTEEPFKAADIKLPEGAQLDETTAGKFVELVNKFGISREAAGELVSMQSELAKVASEANSKLWADMQDKWKKEVETDTEIGGDKLAGHLTSISKVLDKYGSPELRAAFDLTGAGNHPAVIRFMSKIAAVLTEPSFIQGTPAAGAKDLASILYPTQGAN
jgi:hypothetical protein